MKAAGQTALWLICWVGVVLLTPPRWRLLVAIVWGLILLPPALAVWLMRRPDRPLNWDPRIDDPILRDNDDGVVLPGLIAATPSQPRSSPTSLPGSSARRPRISASRRRGEIRAYIRDPDGHLIEVGQTTRIPN
jgi:catechol 2,3-dioxygenase-like lactoylglutathione lyase family enzyme